MTRHLGELNFGILRHDWEDPRVAPFRDALDAVNAIAHRSPGFVWQLGEDEMDAAQNDPNGPLGGNPRMASTLSVWTDPQSLWHFVDRSVHGRYMRRAKEWFEPGDSGHLVLWWIAPGHQPTLAEGMDRHRHMVAHGESAHAFRFSWLQDQGLIAAAVR